MSFQNRPSSNPPGKPSLLPVLTPSPLGVQGWFCPIPTYPRRAPLAQRRLGDQKGEAVGLRRNQSAQHRRQWNGQSEPQTNPGIAATGRPGRRTSCMEVAKSTQHPRRRAADYFFNLAFRPTVHVVGDRTVAPSATDPVIAQGHGSGLIILSQSEADPPTGKVNRGVRRPRHPFEPLGASPKDPGAVRRSGANRCGR